MPKISTNNNNISLQDMDFVGQVQMSDDEEDEKDLFNPANMVKIQKEIERQKANDETRGMFVSGWDDDDQGIEEEKHPHETPEKEILWAAEKGKIDTVSTLLRIDSALVNVIDEDGYTPLHRACYNDHLEVVSLLLQHGADVSARTKMGWEPLHSACQWNHPTCIARLLGAGANVNAPSKGDQTPLHIATSSSHCKRMLQLLLLHPDVDAHIKNHSGDIPKDIARRQGIYDYLFELSDPAIDYIKSPSFTENPFMSE